MGDLKLYKGLNDHALVWSPDDIMELRSKYRIVGKLIGSHSEMARQNQTLSRPVLLTACEVTLLLEKGFAALCEEADLEEKDVAKQQQAYEIFHARSLNEQRKLACENKKQEILSHADAIVVGVMKKRDQVEPSTTKERDEILNSIMDNIQPIEEKHMLVQQPIETVAQYATIASEWTFPRTEFEQVKYLVYKDLWQQQFILTCGAKFGGDFLVYPGDPMLFHAKFIAICEQQESPLQPTDAVQMARLASNVKKTVLLCKADITTGQVMYTKLNYNPR
ncbi:tRNA-splicing endonuclease subunit Sen34-like [Watersipora subatra]|uniref:tRNA-splicing endonuclease subunit Sen34-like n=1 Tax=Watersipora subatra TaxID=2589382 RepID=UPI00355C8A45